MKTLMTLFLILICSTSLFAQEETYFNEWIDFEQTYHKFYIEEDGIYRIPYDALEASGLAGKNAAGFHLFSRGQEVPIYIPPTSEVLSENYIEFYGQKNDGSFDTQLFENPDWQLTPRKSLYTPSIAYYLMWDDGFEGKRIEMAENDLSGQLPEKEAYFIHESELIPRNIFSGGEPTPVAFASDGNKIHMNFADFEKGEGFMSSIIRGETQKTYRLPTLGLYQGENAPLAKLQTKVVGQDDDLFVENDHHLKISINGNTYIDETYEGREIPIYDASVELSDLADVRTEIIYESVGDIFTNPSQDWQSVAYTFLSYPHQFDFSVYDAGEVKDANEFYFELQHLDEAYFEVSHFNSGATALLYDLTHSQRYLIEADENLYKVHLPQGTAIEGESRKLVLTSTEEEEVKTVENLQSLQFTDYETAANQGAYIIISHPSLRTGDTDWVQAYGDYRSSEMGGEFEVVVANMEELYDQFSHGIVKHPLSIRHFTNFAIDKWQIRPEYLFLIGKGIGYRVTTTPSVFNSNLIPTFGHQPSDNMLTARSIYDYRPQLGTGRLSAQTPEDVKNYLNKIQQYENTDDCNIADRAWRKHALLQGNGDNESQYTTAQSYLENYQSLLENNSFGGEILDLQADKNYSEIFMTKPFLEEGVGLVLFMGHSNGQFWKTDILENVNAYAQKTPRFPMIFSGASFAGNIFKSLTSKPAMAESWVLTKDKGAIGFLGKVSFISFEAENVFYEELFQQITQTNYNQPIGKSLKEAIEAIYTEDSSNPLYNQIRALSQNNVYEGDPAVVLGAGGLPEYVIDNDYEHTFIDVEDAYTVKTEIRNDVELFDAVTGEALQPTNVNSVYDFTGMEEVTVRVRVTNLGKVVEENIDIIVTKVDDSGQEIVLTVETVASPTNESVYEFNVPIPVVDEVDNYALGVRVSSSLEEDCNNNNTVDFSITQGSTSINDVWQGGEIQMYPNPVNNQLQIVSSEQAPLLLELMNLQGQLIQRQFMHQGSLTLNFSQLSSGVYWVRLTGEKGVWSQKIVKQ